MLWSLLSRIAGAPQHPVGSSYLSDMVGRRVMLLVFYGSSALTTLFFILVASPGMPLWLIALALILMGFAVYAESHLLQAYLADEASPAIRDMAFGLYFALAFGVGSIWSAILGSIDAQCSFLATSGTVKSICQR